MSNYEEHLLENSELPFIYTQRQLRPRKELFGPSNWHENIEIIHITSGRGAVSNNAQLIEVKAGDIVVINANHLHTIGAYEDTLRFNYLIVDRSFCLANYIDTNKITFNALICDSALQDLLQQLSRTYQADGPYRTLCVRSLVLRIMEQLCLFHSTPVSVHQEPPRIVSCIKQAIDYIRGSFDQSFSLEDVAAFVSLNPYYLSHEFRKYTGCSFITYVNRTRCEHARHLLKSTDMTVGEIARRCGFESRSYFAKSFARYTGVLPSVYRQRAKH